MSNLSLKMLCITFVGYFLINFPAKVFNEPPGPFRTIQKAIEQLEIQTKSLEKQAKPWERAARRQGQGLISKILGPPNHTFLIKLLFEKD